MVMKVNMMGTKVIREGSNNAGAVNVVLFLYEHQLYAFLLNLTLGG